MEQPRYKTDDTPLAAYLFLLGFKIIDIDYSEPRRCQFIFFDGGPEIRDAEHQYDIGKALVEPERYNKIYKRLARRVVTQTPWTEGVMNG